MCCIHVTSLRRPRQPHQAVLLPKCRVSSVSWSRGLWPRSLPVLDTFSDASVRVAVARCHDLLSLAFPVPFARFSLLTGPKKATEKHVLCTPMGIHTYLGSLRLHPSFLSVPHPKSCSILEWGGAGAPPWPAAQVGLGCSLFLSCDLPLLSQGAAGTRNRMKSKVKRQP